MIEGGKNMNIVFYLLVIMALVALWYMLSGMFRPMGRYLYRMYKDTKDIMTEEDEKNIEEEEENEL